METLTLSVAALLQVFSDLLTYGNPKTAKGEGHGYFTAVLHLFPFRLIEYVTCPFASTGCAKGCLNKAGRGGIVKVGEKTNAIQECRKRRTLAFFQHRKEFISHLITKAIPAHIRRATKHGLTPCVRLNGTSDIVWERVAPEVFSAFPEVQFYDYTKIPARMRPTWKLPPNYHLTFSRSETNEKECLQVLQDGANVAVVFHPTLPATWHGYRVISGDTHDLRFTDPKGVVVGLKAKGPAKRDESGFVVRVE